MEQRALDNARVLWDRYVENNRRAVEERSEQLKGVSDLAALIAGRGRMFGARQTDRQTDR
jgi:calcium release-activated calcium channel protein 1